jgi:hypothetical protein
VLVQPSYSTTGTNPFLPESNDDILVPLHSQSKFCVDSVQINIFLTVVKSLLHCRIQLLAIWASLASDVFANSGSRLYMSKSGTIKTQLCRRSKTRSQPSISQFCTISPQEGLIPYMSFPCTTTCHRRTRSQVNGWWISWSDKRNCLVHRAGTTDWLIVHRKSHNRSCRIGSDATRNDDREQRRRKRCSTLQEKLDNEILTAALLAEFIVACLPKKFPVILFSGVCSNFQVILSQWRAHKLLVVLSLVACFPINFRITSCIWMSCCRRSSRMLTLNPASTTRISSNPSSHLPPCWSTASCRPQAMQSCVLYRQEDFTKLMVLVRSPTDTNASAQNPIHLQYGLINIFVRYGTRILRFNAMMSKPSSNVGCPDAVNSHWRGSRTGYLKRGEIMSSLRYVDRPCRWHPKFAPGCCPRGEWLHQGRFAPRTTYSLTLSL